MMIGISMRYDCDHPDCRETGITAVPDSGGAATTAEITAQGESVIRAVINDGWYMGPRGIHCHKHKPRDWDGPTIVAPKPTLKVAG